MRGILGSVNNVPIFYNYVAFFLATTLGKYCVCCVIKLVRLVQYYVSAALNLKQEFFINANVKLPADSYFKTN